MTSASDVMTPQRVSGVISAWNGESGTLKLPKDDVIHTYVLSLYYSTMVYHQYIVCVVVVKGALAMDKI